MKLVYCRICKDMIRLSTNPKSCSCGKTAGVYLKDGLHAVYFGEKAIPIGINNSQFAAAARYWDQSDAETPGPDFEAFIISKGSDRLQKAKDREELFEIFMKDKG